MAAQPPPASRSARSPDRGASSYDQHAAMPQYYGESSSRRYDHGLIPTNFIVDTQMGTILLAKDPSMAQLRPLRFDPLQLRDQVTSATILEGTKSMIHN
jgi:hypothetical protein